MNSISTRFFAWVGLLCLTMASFLIYQTWSEGTRQTEQLLDDQARLALEFSLAIRQYAGEKIRPEMASRIGPDEFIPEAMSTSFIARSVFEKLHEKFPGYIIKFASEKPRNPVNLASPEELKILQYFAKNPDADRYLGRLRIEGKEYIAYSNPMWLDAACLRCHGDPANAPRALVDRYGAEGGFYRQVGDLAGMDLVAVPVEAATRGLQAAARRNALMVMAWFLVLFGSIAVLFRKAVVRPVGALIRAADDMAHGNFQARTEVTSATEIGALGEAFNAMAERLQVAGQEQARAAEARAGLAELDAVLRGEQDLPELCGQTVSFLARYLGASIGALYVCDDDGVVRLQGRYAFPVLPSEAGEFRPGEGVLGQALLENRVIQIESVPADYVAVTSGLVERPPRRILVAPFVLDGEVLGVVELGTLTEFEPHQSAFLEQALPAVGIAVSAARSRGQMGALLEVTRRQKEELEEQARVLRASEERLQEQREELRAANEELEEQAQALRRSEEILKFQQEELQAANEELEERNELLERRRHPPDGRGRADR